MSSIRNAYDEAVYFGRWEEVPNPVVGSNIVLAAFGNARNELVHLSFQFVADANVADRFIRLRAFDGIGGSTLLGGAGVAITAGQTRQINVGQHGHLSISGEDTHYIAIPSFPFIMGGGWCITDIQNIQVGDACTNVSVAWKVWTYER